MKLFTIALPLICAATVGPAAAAEANLRTKTKISDDAASASLFNRRAQGVYAEEMKAGGRNQICAQEYPNVALQMLAISGIMAEFIFSFLGVNPFFSCHDYGSSRRLEEEEPTKEATWPINSITMGELQEALSNIPTLGGFVYPIVVHDPEECVDVQAFAVLINAYFGEMTCNDFYDFLEAGEAFREALAGFGFGAIGPGIGGPLPGNRGAGDIGRRFLNSNNKD